MNKEDNNHFTNLTYQDFWEDKILLMEFDLTPSKIFNGNLDREIFMNIQHNRYAEEVIINNKKYTLYLNNNYKSNNLINYKIEILFYIDPLKKNIDIMSLHSIIRKLPKNWGGIYGLISFLDPISRTYYTTYTHQISLNWEEITDKSYLNFIIKSASKYLKEHLKKHILEMDKKYYKNYGLDTYFNNDNITQLNIYCLQIGNNSYKSVYGNGYGI